MSSIETSNNKYTLCSRCILPHTFPGIEFDEQGICNHCNSFAQQHGDEFPDKAVYERKFTEFVEASERSGSHDILVAYSGGKDSSYTLKLLKERYGLRILALSFDNGFISPLAMRNIKVVTESLGIDLEIVAPSVVPLKKLFRHALSDTTLSVEALKEGSSVCAYCIGMVKSTVLKTALERKIPLCGWGWSPGQQPISTSISPVDIQQIRARQLLLRQKIRNKVGSELDYLFISDDAFAELTVAPVNVHPLAFIDFDEATMFQELKQLGWIRPDDTDKNSSNCVLNALAIREHVSRLDFHPYVWEIAAEVRLNRLSREEGIEKIYGEDDDQIADQVSEKLYSE
jgi:hypothetical protein